MNKSFLLAITASLGLGLAASVYAAPPQYSLAVTVVGDGRVMSDPAGIDCRVGTVGCSGDFKKSTRVTLTATADPDSSFLMWDGDCVGTQPTCEIKMTAPAIVTATFEAAVATPIHAVLKTGQTECWDAAGNPISCIGTGQDGEYQAGAPQPTPRFIDNGDGTVTDSATGLTWLQRPRCLNQLTWADALAAANSLANGQCMLSDGSIPGDWRLPNVRELQSLSSSDAEIKLTGSDITQLPFINVFGNTCGPANIWHWSSTSDGPFGAWVFEAQKSIRRWPKDGFGCAFAVKGGL